MNINMHYLMLGIVLIAPVPAGETARAASGRLRTSTGDAVIVSREVPVEGISPLCGRELQDFYCDLVDTIAPLSVSVPGLPSGVSWRATFRIGRDALPDHDPEFCFGFLWFRLTRLLDGSATLDAMYQRTAPGTIVHYLSELEIGQISALRQIHDSLQVLRLVSEDVPHLLELTEGLSSQVAVPVLPETALITGGCGVEGLLETSSGVLFLSTHASNYSLRAWLMDVWKVVLPRVTPSPVLIAPDKTLDDHIRREFGLNDDSNDDLPGPRR